ncbi:MAG TPA: Fur family transcriptional regulator [Planctomycetota bacterium]|jgi:Fur family ferric uptake transcriptional regulator|nr:Fur family transcriptional regulator [Planctomycetota bacterium]
MNAKDPQVSKRANEKSYLIDKSADHAPGAVGDEERVFEAFLRERGLKFTRARKDLLRKVFAMHDHFTADQLLDRLKASGVRASKATVYRTLAVMAESGLLVGHDFGEGALYYEHTHGHAHHDHLFCLNCKGIVEFYDADLETKQEQIVARLGFQMLTHSLKIYGICKECSALETVAKRYLHTGRLVSQRS